MKTNPRADIQYNHNPVIGDFRVKMKRIMQKKALKFDARKLGGAGN